MAFCNTKFPSSSYRREELKQLVCTGNNIIGDNNTSISNFKFISLVVNFSIFKPYLKHYDAIFI